MYHERNILNAICLASIRIVITAKLSILGSPVERPDIVAVAVVARDITGLPGLAAIHSRQFGSHIVPPAAEVAASDHSELDSKFVAPAVAPVGCTGAVAVASWEFE